VKELVEFLVDDPAAVRVSESFDDRGPRYLLHVAPDDMGKVIGRAGRTAKAIRTVVRAAAARSGQSATVDILDPE
jgi:predicted RNA-binding protein YlqC (UPF0109 family)